MKRNRAKEDERVLIVTLTAEGEKLRDKAVEIPQKLVGASVLTRKRQHHFIKFYIKYWGICNYLQSFKQPVLSEI